MRTRVSWTFVLFAAMLLVAGCQPLKFDKTLSVGVGEVKILNFDAPRYEQKLTVEISSPGAPVSAYLVREADLSAAQERVGVEKAPDSPLAGKERSENINLEATVPAKTAFALLIRADKKAEVKVKVTGR